MTDENRFDSGSYGSTPPVFQPAGGAAPTTSTPSGASQSSATSGQSATDTAKEEAAHVADQAARSAQEVAGVAAERAKDVTQTAKEQVKDTAAEAKQQARDLYEQGRQQVTEQAGAQQQRLAGGVRSVSSELSSMAQSSENPGLATAVARQLADQLEQAGDWLENRDPAQVLQEVSRYARNHPVTFMAIAAGLGLLAGRVARSAKDASSDDAAGSTGSDSTVTSGHGFTTTPPVGGPTAGQPQAVPPVGGTAMPGQIPPTAAPATTLPGGPS